MSRTVTRSLFVASLVLVAVAAVRFLSREALAPLFTFLAAGGALWNAFNSSQAVETSRKAAEANRRAASANLLLPLLKDYASEEFRQSVKRLRDFSRMSNHRQRGSAYRVDSE